jgi:dienelactone hydrolase
MNKLKFILIINVLVISLIASCTFLQGTGGKSWPSYQEVRIPLKGSQQTLQAFVYFPKDAMPLTGTDCGDALKEKSSLCDSGHDNKHDVVIFHHGSAADNPKESLPAEVQASYFLDKGYIVVVPMRKGRGTSDGVSQEGEIKNCDVNSWQPGIESAFEDVSAAVEYALSLPQFDHKIILAGASRGGYLSVAYAAQGPYKDKVQAVVNFVGAWVAQKEDQCPEDFNLVSFSKLGALSNPPNLWLYANNDLLNDKESIQSYYDHFKNGREDRSMFVYTNVPKNGHFLTDYPQIWEKDLTDFLVKYGGKE